MTTYPPGTIGVLSSDLSRYAWFAQNLLSLQVPPGWQIHWVCGQWVSTGLNMLVDSMRPEDQYFLSVTDDHLFEPDLLLRLLAHNLDIVAPLVCLRRLPYAPAIFHSTPEGYKGYTWPELDGHTGLLPVPTMGGPLALIHRRVFDAIGKPWFRSQPDDPNPCEDLYFFDRARQLGFQPYCDLDLILGHILPAAVYPQRMQTGDYAVRVWAHQDLCLLPTTQTGLADSRPYHAYT